MCSRPVLSTLSTPCVTLSFLESELTLRGNHLKSTALAWIGKWLSVSFKRSLTAFAKPLGPLIVPQERRIDLFSLCGAGVHLFTRWFHVSAFTLLIQNLIFWKVFYIFVSPSARPFSWKQIPADYLFRRKPSRKKINQIKCLIEAGHAKFNIDAASARLPLHNRGVPILTALRHPPLKGREKNEFASREGGQWTTMFTVRAGGGFLGEGGKRRSCCTPSASASWPEHAQLYLRMSDKVKQRRIAT